MVHIRTYRSLHHIINGFARMHALLLLRSSHADMADYIYLVCRAVKPNMDEDFPAPLRNLLVHSSFSLLIRV